MADHLEQFVHLYERTPVAIHCPEVAMIEGVPNGSGCVLTLRSGKVIEICGSFHEVRAIINLRSYEARHG